MNTLQQAILDGTSYSIISTDRHGLILTFNRGAERMLGYTAEEMVGRQTPILIHDAEEVASRAEILSKLLGKPVSAGFEAFVAWAEQGKVDENEWTYVRKDGSRFPVLLSVTALHDSEGSISGFLGVAHDISERKQAELEYHTILQVTSDGFWVVAQENGRLIDVNQAACEMIGYRREEMLQMTIPDIDASKSPEEIRQHMEVIVKGGGGRFETVHRRKDGSLIEVEVSTKFVPIRGGVFVAFLRDITARKKAELELIHSERKYRALHESMRDGFVRVDMDKRICEFNSSYQKMLGYTASETRKLTYEQITPEIWHDYEQGIVDTQIFRRGFSDIYEKEYRRKDGTIFPVELRTYLIRDDQGLPSGMWAIVRDISERKRIEIELLHYQQRLEEQVEERTQALQQAQSELLKREKLATLGQLTATVSHELRNPLGAMRPHLSLLKRRLAADDDKGRQSIERIERNIVRCDNIIDELLDFTRIRNLDRISVALDLWLAETLAEQKLPLGMRIVREAGLGDLRVAIDTDRMRRAVINVYENACHAMGERQERENEGYQPHLMVTTRRAAHGRIEIMFADNGAGMSEEVQQQIFEPLFSTKSFGVGLGMPAVQQIMEQHGGGIEVRSQAGKGTQVILWLAADNIGEADENPDH